MIPCVRQAAATLQAQLDGLTVHLLLGGRTGEQTLAAFDVVLQALLLPGPPQQAQPVARPTVG